MGERGHCTPDGPATFHRSLENVIKRSGSLGGQDYDTSLFPVIKGKPVPVTKQRSAGKMLDLPQLSSVHSFTHSEMLMQVHYKLGPVDAEMN